MSLRTEIQVAIIQKIKSGIFTRIDYTDGLPAEAAATLFPEVICNEVGGDLTQHLGRDHKYVLTNWRFETTIKFKQEVDVSDFFMGFNLTFTNSEYAVTIGLDSSYVPEHPVTQGSHVGTTVTVTFVVNLKR